MGSTTTSLSTTAATNVTRSPNILFLMADDLVGYLPLLSSLTSCDADPRCRLLQIPNLQRLAARSAVFTSAYNQFPLCNPSRASLLTGRRPDTTHVYNQSFSFRTVAGDMVTLPQFLKEHGYYSVGMGKVFHLTELSYDSVIHDPESWSEPFQKHGIWDNLWREVVGNGWKAVKHGHSRLSDDNVIRAAIVTLRQLKQFSGEQPFFMAVGFFRPHEPKVFPEKFQSLYPLENLSLPRVPRGMSSVPPLATTSAHTLQFHSDANILEAQKLKPDLSNAKSLSLSWIQAYYSCVSYLDEVVGLLLDELERLGLDENTIVVFLSDHGVKMGEHGAWGKTTMFDEDTRVPLIIRIPGVTDRGIQISQPTELVDVFPTLVEAVGLPALPACPAQSADVPLCREGRSLYPLISPTPPPWDHVAFSQVARGTGFMGYSVMTSRYRYTEWVRFRHRPHYRPDWGSLHGLELYDHDLDPGENHNKAELTEYSEVRMELRERLHAGWTAVVR